MTTGAFFHDFISKEDLGFAVINSHMDRGIAIEGEGEIEEE